MGVIAAAVALAVGGAVVAAGVGLMVGVGPALVVAGAEMVAVGVFFDFDKLGGR